MWRTSNPTTEWSLSTFQRSALACTGSARAARAAVAAKARAIRRMGVLPCVTCRRLISQLFGRESVARLGRRLARPDLVGQPHQRGQLALVDTAEDRAIGGVDGDVH